MLAGVGFWGERAATIPCYHRCSVELPVLDVASAMVPAAGKGRGRARGGATPTGINGEGWAAPEADGDLTAERTTAAVAL